MKFYVSDYKCSQHTTGESFTGCFLLFPLQSSLMYFSQKVHHTWWRRQCAAYNAYHRQVSYLNWMPSWKMTMVSYTLDHQHMSAQNKIHPNKEKSTRCVRKTSQGLLITFLITVDSTHPPTHYTILHTHKAKPCETQLSLPSEPACVPLSNTGKSSWDRTCILCHLSLWIRQKISFHQNMVHMCLSCE